jgi:hypothetical protein
MAEILRERFLCERAQCGRCHPRTDEYRRSKGARCRRGSAGRARVPPGPLSLSQVTKASISGFIRDEGGASK